jgi:hypothetical protein
MPTATGDAEVDREPPDHGPSADPNEPAADGGGPRRLLREAGYAARFLWTLPRYLRRPLTPAEARAEIRRMLRARESGFLDLARRVIYARPAHPVRRLLVAAGCEYGDLVRLVSPTASRGR